MKIMDWYLFCNGDGQEQEALSVVLQHRGGSFREHRVVRDGKRELTGYGWDGGKEMTGCPDSVHSTGAAKLCEAESVGHTQ